jgi:hypothetical protein
MWKIRMNVKGAEWKATKSRKEKNSQLQKATTALQRPSWDLISIS